MNRPGHRIRDLARILPFLGVVAFSPSLLLLFAQAGDVAGAPGLVVYIFSVWAGLVIAALVLAHRLAPVNATRDDPDAPPETRGEQPP